MIIDCFPFYNERDLLEIRLQELESVVDWFVLVEAGETFTGKPKEYVFAENRERFSAYSLCYVKIAAFPTALTSAWQREAYTRNALAQGLQSLRLSPTDVVVLSDVDEIPRPELVAHYAAALTRREIACCVFEQVLSYYYVNCQGDLPWQGTRMARLGDLTTLQELRASTGVIVPQGGWHFSFLGGAERIREKIGAYAHTELDRAEYTDVAHVEACMAAGRDMFGRGITFRCVPLDETFPRFLLRNREKFSHLIAPLPAGEP